MKKPLCCKQRGKKMGSSAYSHSMRKSVHDVYRVALVPPCCMQCAKMFRKLVLIWYSRACIVRGRANGLQDANNSSQTRFARISFRMPFLNCAHDPKNFSSVAVAALSAYLSAVNSIVQM